MPKYIRRFRSILSAINAELYSPALVDVTLDDESKLLMKDVNADDTILRIENDDIEHIEIGPDYLTMKAIIASSVSLSNYGGNLPNIEFSINNDNENWYDWQTYNNYTAIALNAGDNIRFRGLNLNGFSYNVTKYSGFVVTGSINLSGNIMTLIDKLGTTRNIPECPSCFCRLFKNLTAIKTVCKLPAEIVYGGCYFSLFLGTGITDTSMLALPAKVMTCFENMWSGVPNPDCGCYLQMFMSCENLTSIHKLPAATLANECYYMMFKDCTSLTSAPELPATTLAKDCYYSMFNGCINLKKGPSILPALECKDKCYGWMFKNCKNLTCTPELPATTLAILCYDGMFYGCNDLKKGPSILPALTIPDGYLDGNNVYGTYVCMFYGCACLTAAPELPATTLGSYCYFLMFANCTDLTSAPELSVSSMAKPYMYGGMFQNCSKLSYVKCLLENPNEMESDCAWLYNVSATGTFVKKRGITWSRSGASGIPSGWTIEEADY